MAAIGINRQSAYIANIVKCHPMQNPQTPEARGNDRPPTPLETETCSPILRRQIVTIMPKVIVTLGSPSTKMILGTQEGISKIRGKLVPFPIDLHFPLVSDIQLTPEQRAALSGVQVLPMYHPAALLRNPNLKGDAWTDMKLLRDTIGGET
jgi:uracil-DNA glycosylase